MEDKKFLSFACGLLTSIVILGILYVLGLFDQLCKIKEILFS